MPTLKKKKGLKSTFWDSTLRYLKIMSELSPGKEHSVTIFASNKEMIKGSNQWTWEQKRSKETMKPEDAVLWKKSMHLKNLQQDWKIKIWKDTNYQC